MSIYHLNVKTGSKNDGKSSGAKYDYISRCGKYKIDEDEVLYQESGNIPKWAKNNPVLYWRSADIYERKNASLYRMIEFSLPVDLDMEQRLELAKNFSKKLTVNGLFPYSMAIHYGKGHNPHCHLMISERMNDGLDRTPSTWFKRAANKNCHPKTGGARKADLGKHRKLWLKTTRKLWANYANAALKKYGHDSRIDHRTLEAQGIDRIPQKHYGPNVARMEKKGIQTERMGKYFEIEYANELKKETIRIEREIEHRRQNITAKAEQNSGRDCNADSTVDPSLRRPKPSKPGANGSDGISKQESDDQSNETASPADEDIGRRLSGEPKLTGQSVAKNSESGKKNRKNSRTGTYRFAIDSNKYNHKSFRDRFIGDISLAQFTAKNPGNYIADDFYKYLISEHRIYFVIYNDNIQLEKIWGYKIWEKTNTPYLLNNDLGVKIYNQPNEIRLFLPDEPELMLQAVRLALIFAQDKGRDLSNLKISGSPEFIAKVQLQIAEINLITIENEQDSDQRTGQDLSFEPKPEDPDIDYDMRM